MSISINELKQRLFKKHNNTIALDELTYKDVSTKCRFIDKDYGEFWAIPYNIVNGVKSAKRASKERKLNKITIEEVKNRLFEVHGDSIKILEHTYVSYKIKCSFIDEEYGIFQALPSNVIRGSVCKLRSNKNISKIRTMSIEEVKQRLYKIHGDIVSIDESSYVRFKKHAIFIDKYYGSWVATPSNVIYHKNKHPQRAYDERMEKLSETMEKIKKINLEKYGNEYFFGSNVGKEKSKNAIRKIYGVDNIFQLEQIKKISRETNMRKLGVCNPQQNKQIALKTAKSCNNSYILCHWKTNEELVCVASYEKKVVEYLNQNKIDFEWQIPINIPNGRVYFVDCYLIEQDKYIEIKGWFRKDALEKWNWFHENYPNSELWDKKKAQRDGN